MGFDVVLIAVIVGGIVLSGAYVAAEYRGWRAHGAAQRRRVAALRDLHAASLSEQRDALLPSVLRLQGFSDSDAANLGPGNPPRTAPLAERRRRARHRATH
jgi:hypothetical protein